MDCNRAQEHDPHMPKSPYDEYISKMLSMQIPPSRKVSAVTQAKTALHVIVAMQ